MRVSVGLALFALAAAAILAAIAWVFLAGPWRAVDLDARAPALTPIFHANTSAQSWLDQRAGLRGAFEREVYGPMPAPIAPAVTRREDIAPAHAGGVERVEQWRVEVGAAGHFHLAIARPAHDAPSPVILVMDFCGNRAAFPGRPRAIAPPVGYIQWFCKIEALDPIVKSVFGPYINGPPFELIASRGYAVAMLYAGDIVPDGDQAARAALSRFAPTDTGALMAWAWVASRAYEAIASDPRFDASRIVVFGQSRQGKSALIAGAFDDRFAAVVSLQSGRGGDAPMTAFEGETLAHMTRTYPHWFTPRFAREAPGVDQHQLLALIAPRPLLLGDAGRDRWADPVGARAVREAAAPAFRLLGAPPPLVYMRGGGHGIHREDWVTTLNFLDARLPR
ncbi:MAG TPA: hypothetical protein VEF55_10375 [Candidatus Binatia bacterium]|nr:hypothetical protein [Candidatus Binatia bacterium]